MSYAGYACLMESALALTLTGFALQINSVQETEKKKKSQWEILHHPSFALGKSVSS